MKNKRAFQYWNQVENCRKTNERGASFKTWCCYARQLMVRMPKESFFFCFRNVEQTIKSLTKTFCKVLKVFICTMIFYTVDRCGSFDQISYKSLIKWRFCSLHSFESFSNQSQIMDVNAIYHCYIDIVIPVIFACCMVMIVHIVNLATYLSKKLKFPSAFVA